MCMLDHVLEELPEVLDTDPVYSFVRFRMLPELLLDHRKAQRLREQAQSHEDSFELWKRQHALFIKREIGRNQAWQLLSEQVNDWVQYVVEITGGGCP